MPRVLLLMPSATYRAPDFLEAARALDVEVVVGCEEPQVLSGLMGTRALRLPLDDPDAAAKAIVEHDSLTPLDAIVAVDDQGAVAAAAASERLGLHHNPPRAVAATRDKLAMRALLAQHEVPQPTYGTIPAGARPAEVALAVKTVGLPCVVKPTTLSASQGVLRADSLEGAAAVAQRVRRIAIGAGVDPEAPLLVERFVPGQEVALEGLLDDGALDVLAVFDKPDPLDGPAFEETIYVTPSRLTHRDIEAVVDATRKATRALGLREGPVHAELRLRDARAWVIEVAARTIGGLCSRALAFSTGRTLEQLVLAHAIGSPMGPLQREDRASGVLMLPIPRAGTLLGVEGVSRALAVPGVSDVQITIAPGREVVPVPEGNRYLGFVFARAKRPADAETALRRALSLLEVRIEG
ncbi:MAG: ATP-grasp domain-containing protein [Acidimicrobiales bacterium]